MPPAPSAVATGGLLPEAASLQQIINPSRFCSSACGPPGTSKHASLSSLFLPSFILCLKMNFVFPFNNQTFMSRVGRGRAAGLCAFLPRVQRGSSSIPVLACKRSVPQREARVGSDATRVLQGKGQPCSSASPLPTWVSHALGTCSAAYWHARGNG